MTLGRRTAERESNGLGHIDKLVLQVAEICNLTCSFCITQQGRWSGDKSEKLMAPETAKAAVLSFARHFDPIHVINFFGGEPALNLRALAATGEAVKIALDSGMLSATPVLSMATNGTVASRAFVETVSRYDVHFAVSVDGPREVHDIERRTASGKPTYDEIVANVSKLRDLTGYPKGIALTYTTDHLHSPKTLWEMLDELRSDFGVDEFAVMPATNSPHTPGQWDPLVENPDKFIEEYADAVRRSLGELAASPNGIKIQYGKNALANLVEPLSYEECPAGRNYFSISVAGSVFPCQNLPEDDEYRISHVGSPRLVDDILGSSIRQSIEVANAEAIRTIGDDPARSLCRICPSDNLGEVGSLTTYSPGRMRLYQAIDAVVKGTFIDLISEADDAQADMIVANLTPR